MISRSLFIFKTIFTERFCYDETLSWNCLVRNKYVETFKFKDAKWCDDVDCSTCTIPYRNICIKLGLIFTLMKNRSLWIWNPQFLNRIRRSSWSPLCARHMSKLLYSNNFDCKSMLVILSKTLIPLVFHCSSKLFKFKVGFGQMLMKWS